MNPKNQQAEQAFERLGSYMAGRGVEEAMEVGASLSGEDSERFLAAAMPELAAKDPDAVREMLEDESLGLGGRPRLTALYWLGFRLGANDASATMAWIGALPEGEQPYAMRGLASTMASSDSEGFANLLGSMPRTETWAAGVKVLISNLEGADPATAEAWQRALEESGLE